MNESKFYEALGRLWANSVNQAQIIEDLKLEIEILRKKTDKNVRDTNK